MPSWASIAAGTATPPIPEVPPAVLADAAPASPPAAATISIEPVAVPATKPADPTPVASPAYVIRSPGSSNRGRPRTRTAPVGSAVSAIPEHAGLAQGHTISLSRSSSVATAAAATQSPALAPCAKCSSDPADDVPKLNPFAMPLVHVLDLADASGRRTPEQSAGLLPVSVLYGQKWVVVGCRAGQIVIVDAVTLTPVATLDGHLRAVLSLAWFDDDKGASESQVISSSADGTVRIWDLAQRTCTSVVISADAGSVFATQYVPATHTLYLGCQNTSLQWLHPSGTPTDPAADARTLAYREQSYFFAPRPVAAFLNTTSLPSSPKPVAHIVPDTGVLAHAHAGYIYAVTSAPRRAWLVTGGGDGTVKVWSVTYSAPTLVRTLRISDDDGVASFALDQAETTLYVGLQSGAIAVWDLDTAQCIRQLVEHTDAVTWVATMRASGAALGHGMLVSASLDGSIKVWAQRSNYQCLATVNAQAPVVDGALGAAHIATVHEDGRTRVWQLPAAVREQLVGAPEAAVVARGAAVDDDGDADALLYALRNWVPYRTISGDDAFAEQCRAGAQYLRSVLTQLGANAKLLPGAPGRNPLVLGQFTGKPPAGHNRGLHVLFYGHYDVVPTDPEQWETDPFTMTGHNGFLYGRGVSDDKGPILAAIFAVADLASQGQLNATVTFLIEGEEESGSAGLAEAVEAHAHDILTPSAVDVILMSNSSWLGETVPCLVYGQRGVVHAHVTVEGGAGNADRHAGVDGGAVAAEPLPDLIHVLASLLDPAAPHDRRVRIPGFYDAVAPITPADDARLDALVARIVAVGDHPAGADPAALKHSLVQKWRTPTLTIAHVGTSSGAQAKAVISRRATATISLRTVPHQHTADLVASLTRHLHAAFATLPHSANRLSVAVSTAADWWVGKPDGPYFAAAARALSRVWGRGDPLAVMEGGSTLPLHWLRKRLAAVDADCRDAATPVVPVVNVPLAQASDRAHLANERISVANLVTGRRALREVVRNLQAEFAAPRGKEEKVTKV
ncbi:hypothetical protein GGF31_005498 [Allomyces arbusculus]|nr:hypothetical protein GGF31_005498 [Allomyces arbusculus]